MSRMTTDELLAKYPHYYKDVRHLEVVDIYRVLALFGVTDPAVQHAVKKLMVPGKRGGKDVSKDLDEAMHTLERGAIMREEDLLRGKLSPKPAVVVTNTVSPIPQLSDEQIESLLNNAPQKMAVRDINACAIPDCTARREVGSSFCSRHQPPKAPEAPKPWSQGDYSAPPPPPPPAPVAPSLPVPVPSLPVPSLPVDGLALAVHNNVNASSPSPLPRC